MGALKLELISRLELKNIPINKKKCNIIAIERPGYGLSDSIPNFKILDWVNHKKILKYYNNSAISVVPSKWQEPFGRTAMESAAAGCATITSTKGGLPETFDNKLFINQVNESELFKMIDFLIENKKIRRKHQQFNWKNVKHKLSSKVNKIDNLDQCFLNLWPLRKTCKH